MPTMQIPFVTFYEVCLCSSFKMDMLQLNLCMNVLKQGSWDCAAERDLDERDREQCSSHHLSCKADISGPCCAFILCYLRLRGSINMQNSRMIKVLSEEVQGKRKCGIVPGWRQILMASLIYLSRTAGSRLRCFSCSQREWTETPALPRWFDCTWHGLLLTPAWCTSLFL